MTKEIRTGISIKRKETLIKKKRSELCHSPERIRTKTFIFNTYKTRETTIYKRISRRFVLQEMNTIK